MTPRPDIGKLGAWEPTSGLSTSPIPHLSQSLSGRMWKAGRVGGRCDSPSVRCSFPLGAKQVQASRLALPLVEPLAAPGPFTSVVRAPHHASAGGSSVPLGQLMRLDLMRVDGSETLPEATFPTTKPGPTRSSTICSPISSCRF